MDSDVGIDFITIPVNTLFMDDTECFTPRLQSRNQYIMVALHCLSNAIILIKLHV